MGWGGAQHTFQMLGTSRVSSVGAACKVSPNWLQETVTGHSSHCLGSRKRTIGRFSSEQLLHVPSKVLSRKLKEIVCSLVNCIYHRLKLSVASSLFFLELLISMLL